jgi:hypothetical protein
VRLRRIFLLLAAGALAGNLAVACDSAEDVGAGGTCFLLTDCAEGLFCHRPEAGVSGTCEGKGELGTIQPAGDATLADAGPMPEPGDAAPPPAEDSATGEDAPTAQVDAQTADRTAPADTGPPPVDSGNPKPDTSTPDTSVPDTSAPDTSAPDTSMPADTGPADTSSSPGD